MIVYEDYVTFMVMGKKVILITEDMFHSYNTVAEIDDEFHYLGNEPPTIASAIFAWQEMNDRYLTEDELRQVMTDNHLLPQTI